MKLWPNTRARDLAPRIFVLLLAGYLGVFSASAQCAPRKMQNDLEYRGLVGPVHVVQKRDVSRSSDPGISNGPQEELVFDKEGFLIETRIFDSTGAMISQTVMLRTDGRVQETEITHFGGSDAKRVVLLSPKEGSHEIDTFNLDGSLRDRRVIERTPTGSHETQYDATGRLVSDVQHSSHTESEGDSLHVQRYDNGKLTKTITAEGDPQDRKLKQQDQNGRIEMLRQRDPTGERVIHVSPYGTQMAACDAQGRVETDVHDDGKFYTRSSYKYDSRGRVQEIDSYDREGKLTGRNFKHYDDDAHGNWIRETEETSSSGSDAHQVTVVERNITYY